MDASRRIGNYVFDTNNAPVTRNRFGGIYHGRDILNNREVAVNVIPLAKHKHTYGADLFQDKVDYLKAVRGPNVVQLYDVIVTPAPGYIYVVTEATHHRQLGTLMNRTGVIPESHASQTR